MREAVCFGQIHPLISSKTLSELYSKCQTPSPATQTPSRYHMKFAISVVIVITFCDGEPGSRSQGLTLKLMLTSAAYILKLE